MILRMRFLLFIACFVGLFYLPGCDNSAENNIGDPKSNEEAATATRGLLADICDSLVARDVASSCGTETEPCDGSEDPGCLHLHGADIVIGSDANDYGPNSEDPPVDLEGLFDALPFMEEDDKDAIVESGVIMVGDPEAEEEVFVEINIDEYSYLLDDGGGLADDEKNLEAIDGAEDIKRFFPLLGVHEGQAVIHQGNVASSSKSQDDDEIETRIVAQTVHVYREINGIQVPASRLIFKYNGKTAGPNKISGAWESINYEESQFSLSYDSMDELIDDLLDHFEDRDIIEGDMEDVSLGLSYDINEKTLALELKLCVTAGNSETCMAL